MRAALTLCAAAVAVAAQTAVPPGIVRGDLLEWESVRGGGELSIRTPSHQVFRFSYDARTYVERERERTSIDKLQKGDQLEIVSDQTPGVVLRYARTVHVVEQAQPRRAQRSFTRSRAYRSAIDSIAPRGDLTFAGVVARITGERLVLRTRRDGDKTILLRDDTRFLDNGTQVAASALAPSTRVFIRGSRNFENEIEAYQVVWGEILDPAPPR